MRNEKTKAFLKGFNIESSWARAYRNPYTDEELAAWWRFGVTVRRELTK